MAHISMMFDTEGHYKVAVSKDGEAQLLPKAEINPSDRDRFLCSLRLLRDGKIIVGAEPDDADEGATTFHTLREIIESGTKRLACFFRKAIFDAQSFCGEPINVIVLLIPAEYTTAERMKLYAAASILNVSIRLITVSDALAFAFADEYGLHDNEEKFYGVLHMDMESVETALYGYSSDVMELIEIHIEESPMRKLEHYVVETLSSALESSGVESDSISFWAFQKIAYRLFQLSEHDFPYSVDLSEVTPSASGTYSFEWKAVMNGIGDFHITDLKNNWQIYEYANPSDPFLLIVNGYDYHFPIIEAAIKRQNKGGRTLFCREKPYALLAACNYASMFLGKSDNPKLMLSSMPHSLSIATGATSRILLAKSGTTLPTKKTVRLSIDPNGQNTADIIVYEHETPILYTPIPLPKGSAVYTLTFDQRFGSGEAKQKYYTAHIDSEDGLSYDLLPCDAALIPKLSDSFGPIIKKIDEDDHVADGESESSNGGDSGMDNAESAKPSFDPLKNGDTILFKPLRSNQMRLYDNSDSLDALSFELMRMIDSGVKNAEDIVEWLNQVEPQL